MVIDYTDMEELKERFEDLGVEIQAGPGKRWGSHGDGISLYIYDPGQQRGGVAPLLIERRVWIERGVRGLANISPVDDHDLPNCATGGGTSNVVPAASFLSAVLDCPGNPFGDAHDFAGGCSLTGVLPE